MVKRALFLSLFVHLCLLLILIWSVQNGFLGFPFLASDGTSSVFKVRLGDSFSQQEEAGSTTPQLKPSRPSPISSQKIFRSPEKNPQIKDSPGPIGSGDSKGESSAVPASEGGVSKGSGGSLGGVDIRVQIQHRLQRAIRYPSLARAKGIEGVTIVVFSIQPEGQVIDLKIAQSSGSEILDEEALATVRRATPLPYYPKVLQIPLRFSLE